MMPGPLGPVNAGTQKMTLDAVARLFAVADTFISRRVVARIV